MEQSSGVARASDRMAHEAEKDIAEALEQKASESETKYAGEDKKKAESPAQGKCIDLGCGIMSPLEVVEAGHFEDMAQTTADAEAAGAKYEEVCKAKAIDPLDPVQVAIGVEAAERKAEGDKYSLDAVGKQKRKEGQAGVEADVAVGHLAGKGGGPVGRASPDRGAQQAGVQHDVAVSGGAFHRWR